MLVLAIVIDIILIALPIIIYRTRFPKLTRNRKKAFLISSTGNFIFAVGLLIFAFTEQAVFLISFMIPAVLCLIASLPFQFRDN